MAENVDRATPSQLRELVQLLVEAVHVSERAVVGIDWTPASVPFVEAAAQGAMQANRA